MRRVRAILALLATLAVSPPRLSLGPDSRFTLVWGPSVVAAQSDLGLPAWYPSNILATSRSPLYFQPWIAPHPGTRVTVALDYANIYELAYGPVAGAYVQDLELGTLHLGASRDLDAATFIAADLPVSTAWKGGLDGFLKWWHGLLGIKIPERELRPEHRFGFDLTLPNGSFDRAPATYLGDLRLGLGRRIGKGSQLLGTLTLPTTTNAGYAKRVPSIGLLYAGQTDLAAKLRVEGTAGLGYTPRTSGLLRSYQRDVFLSMGGGFRWHFAGITSMFGTLWWSTPYYSGTGIAGLDRPDMTFDFGWIFRSRSGVEWRIGMSEDPVPSGPGVDAVFKASRSW